MCVCALCLVSFFWAHCERAQQSAQTGQCRATVRDVLIFSHAFSSPVRDLSKAHPFLNTRTFRRYCHRCTEVKFGETPIMSTYLLAFVVGDFDYVEVCFPVLVAYMRAPAPA